MANTERIDQVIASIRGEIERTKACGFNMNYSLALVDDHDERIDQSGRSCGTVACIAGHAYALAKVDREVADLAASNVYLSVFETAQDYLDLTSEEKNVLFFASNSDFFEEHLEDIPAEHAIRVLEDFKVSGVIDWDKHADEETFNG